jgi:O-glycosyl hydrolase
MKRNGRLDNFRHSGRVLSRFFPALAAYLVRFLLDYRRSGVNVSALAPQNEPGIATRYPGAELSVSAEAAFVRNYLVPALARAGLGTGWASWSIPYAVSLARRSVARQLTGIATHCYFGSPSEMSQLHYINPLLDQIVSECSPGIMPYPTSELLIAAMRNWASAVSLWNLALDRQGQPVQAPNSGCPRCTGLVTVDEGTHSAALTLDYYQLGQVSKFVRPGAVRLASNHYVSYRYLGRGRDIATAGLDDVAFRNPDGSKVLVVYNGGMAERRFTLRSDGRYLSDVLAAQETATLVWDKPRGRS